MPNLPTNAGIETPRSLWGANPTVRNIVLAVVACLIIARIATAIWLVEHNWRSVARWLGVSVAPAPDQALAGRRLQPVALLSHFGPDAYPEDARDKAEEGKVRAVLYVGSDGRVTACRIRASSRSRSLDNATCRRGLEVSFEPARDRTGAAVASSYVLAVSWRLPRP